MSESKDNGAEFQDIYESFSASMTDADLASKFREMGSGNDELPVEFAEHIEKSGVPRQLFFEKLAETIERVGLKNFSKEAMVATAVDYKRQFNEKIFKGPLTGISEFTVESGAGKASGGVLVRVQWFAPEKTAALTVAKSSGDLQTTPLMAVADGQIIGNIREVGVPFEFVDREVVPGKTYHYYAWLGTAGALDSEGRRILGEADVQFKSKSVSVPKTRETATDVLRRRRDIAELEFEAENIRRKINGDPSPPKQSPEEVIRSVSSTFRVDPSVEKLVAEEVERLGLDSEEEHEFRLEIARRLSEE